MLYVITGPPCAGKSTWVRDRAKPGDIVIDLDRMALALTAEETAPYEYPRHIRLLAMAARKAVIGLAVTARNADIYLIHSKPSGKQKSQYIRARAQFVELSAPLEELMRRAIAERPDWYLPLIARWFDEPESE